MADERAYRVHLRYHSERFKAELPELGISAEGESRAEALAAVEAALDARLQSIAEGESLPPPIDVKEVPTELSVKLSLDLARDLHFEAARAGLEPAAYAAELIARGVGRGDRRPPRSPPAEARSPDAQPTDNEGRRPDRGGDRGDRGGNRRGRPREGYRPELDDKANFMEYLRNLEKGPGGPGRGRR